mmetsp:Transcript_14908/g.21853  ORF Transcript_14908/g.21853 Transcript_14908/m.21853 type:complete len:92 (+) Transcript_14908:476-751(+)
MAACFRQEHSSFEVHTRREPPAAQQDGGSCPNVQASIPPGFITVANIRMEDVLPRIILTFLTTIKFETPPNTGLASITTSVYALFSKLVEA